MKKLKFKKADVLGYLKVMMKTTEYPHTAVYAYSLGFLRQGKDIEYDIKLLLSEDTLKRYDADTVKDLFRVLNTILK